MIARFRKNEYTVFFSKARHPGKGTQNAPRVYEQDPSSPSKQICAVLTKSVTASSGIRGMQANGTPLRLLFQLCSSSLTKGCGWTRVYVRTSNRDNHHMPVMPSSIHKRKILRSLFQKPAVESVKRRQRATGQLIVQIRTHPCGFRKPTFCRTRQRSNRGDRRMFCPLRKQ